MPISIQCPGCHKSLKAKDELGGKRVKCPACGTAVVVPEVAVCKARVIFALADHRSRLRHARGAPRKLVFKPRPLLGPVRHPASRIGRTVCCQRADFGDRGGPRTPGGGPRIERRLPPCGRSGSAARRRTPGTHRAFAQVLASCQLGTHCGGGRPRPRKWCLVRLGRARRASQHRKGDRPPQFGNAARPGPTGCGRSPST